MARTGAVGRGRRGVAWRDADWVARWGKPWQARCGVAGMAWPDEHGHGNMWQARRGWVWIGEISTGRRGMISRDKEWQGLARCDIIRQAGLG